ASDGFRPDPHVFPHAPAPHAQTLVRESLLARIVAGLGLAVATIRSRIRASKSRKGRRENSPPIHWWARVVPDNRSPVGTVERRLYTGLRTSSSARHPPPASRSAAQIRRGERTRAPCSIGCTSACPAIRPIGASNA